MILSERALRFALERLAAHHKISYLHVHMAFWTFHNTMNERIRRKYPRGDAFWITPPEIVGVACLFGRLPEEVRLRSNLMTVLYALLAVYFSFWGVDFMSFGMRRIARFLTLDKPVEFEEFVVYVCTHFYKDLFSISQRSDAYEAWESYLFPTG